MVDTAVRCVKVRLSQAGAYPSVEVADWGYDAGKALGELRDGGDSRVKGHGGRICWNWALVFVVGVDVSVGKWSCCWCKWRGLEPVFSVVNSCIAKSVFLSVEEPYPLLPVHRRRGSLGDRLKLHTRGNPTFCCFPLTPVCGGGVNCGARRQLYPHAREQESFAEIRD